MKISPDTLLEKGYFLREFPPPFNSKDYATKYRSMFTLSKLQGMARGDLGNSECVYFSLPKAGFTRRILSLPNPLHYSILSEVVSKNLGKLQRYLDSRLSCSLPTLDASGQRAFTTKTDFGKFKRHCFSISDEAMYELKVDLSRFYPTIYTHIIPWALHGREVAKKKWNDKKLLGNIIDKHVRDLQSGQTMGIPIGPDISLLVAELVACRLDKTLTKKFKKLKAARFIDDYYLYFSTLAEAETVLKYLQTLFSEYLLVNNEEKTAIKEFPFNTDAPWIISLRSLRATCFKDNADTEQEADMRQFFSAVFDWAEKYPKDEVMKYAVRIISSVEISEKNWDYFQAWVIKMSLYDPYVLPEICATLFTYKKWVSKKIIRSFIHELLERHTLKRHSFEVAWTLWLAKIFQITINPNLARRIFDSNDVLPTLLALDLKASGLISKKVKTSHLKHDLTEASLRDGRWLLTYEAIQQGWLTPLKAHQKAIKNNKFFSELEKNKVSFYDTTALPHQIPPMKKKEGKTPLITKTKQPFFDPELAEWMKNTFGSGYMF